MKEVEKQKWTFKVPAFMIWQEQCNSKAIRSARTSTLNRTSASRIHIQTEQSCVSIVFYSLFCNATSFFAINMRDGVHQYTCH